MWGIVVVLVSFVLLPFYYLFKRLFGFVHRSIEIKLIQKEPEKSAEHIAKKLFGAYSNSFNVKVIREIIAKHPNFTIEDIADLYPIYHIRLFKKLKKQ